MKKKVKLSPSMTLSQFDNGYWYATELKDFAKFIGIPFATQLRKDELEESIKRFLETGKTDLSIKRHFSNPRTKDVDLGLRVDLPIAVYTNNRETKDFLEKEGRQIAPGLKLKSGSRYRLNRWREEQLAKGRRITYGDLVREYVRLNQTKEPFAKIPQDRYVNFLSDFLKAEKNSTREQGIKVWKELKSLDIPKNYSSWKKYQRSGTR